MSGFLEVGITPDGKEVIVNHPDLLPDAKGVGHIIFSPAQARDLALVLLKKSRECTYFSVDLANEQTLCDDMRRGAPDHTYQNDEQVVLGLKRILDLNMGVSSIDALYMMVIALRARAGIRMPEQKLILALLIEVLHTRRCDDCKGSGKRVNSTLDCEHCTGTGVRFMRL